MVNTLSTVSTLSIVFMVISLFLSVVFPVGLVIYFYRKYKISFKYMGIGALVFFLFQIVTRIPLLGYLNTNTWFSINVISNPQIYILFLAFTAGLFEEGGRFLAFKFLLKKDRSWSNGIAFGIGHGGIEAIYLVGLSYINLIVMSFMLNSGALEGVLQLQGQSASQIMALQNTLTNTPSYMFLLAGLERVMTILLQIGFSLIVLYGVKNRKNIYLLYAIALHALIDVIAVVSKNVFLTEGILLVMGIVAFILIKKSKSKFDINPSEKKL